MGLIVLFSFLEIPKAVSGPVIQISFEIARKRDCLGFGICNLNANISWEIYSPKGNNVSASAQEVNGKLVLTLNKENDMTREAYNKYFSNGYFLFEEDFSLPPEFCRKLGLEKNYTIKKGKYKTQEESNMIRLLL